LIFNSSGISAVRAVAAGSRYYSRALRHALPAEMTPAVVRESGAASLTPRQLEILKLIARGNTTKEVARQLGISIKTAQTHRTQLMERLDIHDVAGLVRYAIRAGLVTPDK
jgi:DNA-binding NarL/FixJ family response regulator